MSDESWTELQDKRSGLAEDLFFSEVHADETEIRIRSRENKGERNRLTIVEIFG